ncbi:hypothetical protein BDB01DRAFT_895978 [Pilobolus umbonatus]|nr:hypothetical protein BDB01DRAFT_895978 [Pilobolus umbonatus]
MRSILSAFIIVVASFSTPVFTRTLDTTSNEWRAMMMLPDSVEEALPMSGHPVVPIMIVSDDYFPAPSNQRKPLYKYQLDHTIGPSYKHMGIATSEDTFSPIYIAPLPPFMQSELNADHAAKDKAIRPTIPSNDMEDLRHYKKFIGLSDDGTAQFINLPSYESETPISGMNEDRHAYRIQDIKLVGMDTNGKTRYIDIPVYDRGV